MAECRRAQRLTQRELAHRLAVSQNYIPALDLGARVVTRSGQEVRLSPTEYVLLAELAKRPGMVLDHRTLLTRVWGPMYAGDRNYLRTFVQRLCRKLEVDPAEPEIIVTAGRRRYRFGPPVDLGAPLAG